MRLSEIKIGRTVIFKGLDTPVFALIGSEVETNSPQNCIHLAPETHHVDLLVVGATKPWVARANFTPDKVSGKRVSFKDYETPETGKMSRVEKILGAFRADRDPKNYSKMETSMFESNTRK